MRIYYFSPNILWYSIQVLLYSVFHQIPVLVINSFSMKKYVFILSDHWQNSFCNFIVTNRLRKSVSKSYLSRISFQIIRYEQICQQDPFHLQFTWKQRNYFTIVFETSYDNSSHTASRLSQTIRSWMIFLKSSLTTEISIPNSIMV